LTYVADTRFLITFWFPPDQTTKMAVIRLMRTAPAEGLLIPSIAITEYIRVAGKRVGIEASETHIRSLLASGARVRSIDERIAFTAGELALRYPDVPIADAVIAAVAVEEKASFVITDDEHFRHMGLRTKWI